MKKLRFRIAFFLAWSVVSMKSAWAQAEGVVSHADNVVAIITGMGGLIAGLFGALGLKEYRLKRLELEEMRLRKSEEKLLEVEKELEGVRSELAVSQASSTDYQMALTYITKLARAGQIKSIEAILDETDEREESH